jgi:hypothetical protein
MGAKSWIYKGLVLKSEAKILGITANEMLNEFKPNSSVSASKFDAPNDVSYANMNSAAQQMGGESGIGDLFGAMSEMEYEDEDDEYYDDEPMVPVEYPFSKFKEVIADFNYLDYTCVGTNSVEGMHASSFMSGMNSIMIMAQSKQNVEMDQSVEFEKFSHKGHTCYYGKLQDEEDGTEEGTALFIEYPAHDMYIMIIGIPDLSKAELIKVSDQLDF